jgi:Putative F0F1-ATPase subunit Ca2+/Mg2+ transporter
MALAMEWVAKITTVGLEMVLPGLAGRWLDSQLGTGFLVLLGFGLGLIAGFSHLLLMTGALGRKNGNHKPPESPSHRDPPL